MAICAPASAISSARADSRPFTLSASCTISSRLIAKRFATWANGCQKQTATASRPENSDPASSIAVAASSEPS